MESSASNSPPVEAAGNALASVVIQAAIAVIRRGNRLLICQRMADDSFGGYWEFPGGGVEPGESLTDCLHRELREELLYAVTIGQPLTPIRHSVREGVLILNPFLCDAPLGEPIAVECQQFKWIDPAALPNYQFPPGNQELIAEVMASMKG